VTKVPRPPRPAEASTSQSTTPPAAATPEGSIHAFVESRWRILLAGVLVVAALVRVAILVELRRTPYWEFLLWDERTYHSWARHLLTGDDRYVYSLSPLPAYLVAAVYRLFGADPLHFRIVNVVLGVALCAVLFAIGRRLGGIAVGLGSALVGALYQPFAFWSVTLLKEPLGLLLFATLVLLSLQELERHHPGRALLAGLVAGALVNVRQNAVVALAVLAAVLAVRVARAERPRRAALAMLCLCAGFAAAVTPFAVANRRGTGVASPLPLGGFDLYRGNTLAGPTPYYNPVPFSSTHPDTQGIEFTIEASRREGRQLTLAEGSAYWTREVAREARRQPAAFGRKLLQKLLASLNAWEESDNHSLQLMSGFLPALRVSFFAFWLVMPLGLASLVVHARRDRRAAVLLAVVLAYGASMVLVFPNMRVRAPLLVILIPYMVAGLARYRAWLAGESSVLAFAGLALALVALELVPVPGTRDLTAHYNTHAIALMSQGRSEEAVGYWRASSEAHGTYSAYADLALAGLARMDGDLEGAARWLDRIPGSSFAAADKHRELGAILASQGKREQAAAALERSLSINSADVGALETAIELYEAVDPKRASALREELAAVRHVR
jgi:4-amino-4-deoxy-L-arabinose transferase-like glycosyltransferase